ncbi:FAD-dependent oxidoreductase [Actinomadura rubrisoli]|uniref:FAD-dependent oxidoreductase n=1 Tax=Actinomadura rubrisoli TaxID=2530368 RepID=A0A4V6PF93_9ACTN|nr:FAD-dependent oxidoreductase [Actinomadura rubrisoli]TDD96307.1 FAD-dependent oxidoreductase [Actinomadura rubrisoli]
MTGEPRGAARTAATPVRLGALTLANRVVAAPMERNYCGPDGVPTGHYEHQVSALARGGSALVYAEAAYVRADGRVRPRQLAIDDDGAIAGVRRLADAVHRGGALFGMQLVHGGRLARAEVSGFTSVAPSPVAATVIDGDLPLELDAADAADLVERFGAAARRSVRAGADVISIHAAHGYLISQFLSPRTNLRADRYGDPAVFLREVIAAVRAAVPGTTVGVRVSAYEGVPDGLGVDETVQILDRAGAGGLDFIDVSAGCYEAGQWITPTGELPAGLHAVAARGFADLGPPVGVAGRIADGATAEHVLRDEGADFITVGRALHADPSWTAKILRGEPPRPCIACNYCADMLRTGEPVGCTVNPEAHEALPAAPAPDGEQPDVLVVGAGPAGLEAACRSAALGRRTRIVDRSDHLGGTFALAAGLHEYPEYHRIVDWYAGRLDRLGVLVELGTEVAPGDLAGQDEDLVIMATGLPGLVPDVPGAGLPRVRELTAWLDGGLCAPLDSEYVVWGADRDGAAVADHLAARGVRVVLVGAGDEPAEDVGPRAKLLPLARLRADAGVEFLPNATIESIEPDAVHVRTFAGRRVISGTGPVLVSLGPDGSGAPIQAARAAAPGKTVTPVGAAAGHGGWTAIAVRHAAETVITARPTEPRRHDESQRKGNHP